MRHRLEGLLSLFTLSSYLLPQLLRFVLEGRYYSVLALFSLQNFIFELPIDLEIDCLQLFESGFGLESVGTVILLDRFGEPSHLLFEESHLLIVGIGHLGKPILQVSDTSIEGVHSLGFALPGVELAAQFSKPFSQRHSIF